MSDYEPTVTRCRCGKCGNFIRAVNKATEDILNNIADCLPGWEWMQNKKMFCNMCSIKMVEVEPFAKKILPGYQTETLPFTAENGDCPPMDD